jgi:Ca2+-binding RTX toxin-like protein
MRTITLTTSGGVQTFTLSDTASAEETRATIQQALDLAANATGGGKVELSEGVYVVAPGATAGDGALRVGSNTEFAGAGLGLTQIKLADAPGHDVTGVVRTDSGKTAADGLPISTHDVVIRDLTIDGNKANAGTALVDGFFCGPKPFTELAIDTNIRLERVEVMNASRYGFDPHERTDNLTFAACVAHDNVYDGFTIDYCSNVTLIDCEAYANGRHGVNVVTSSSSVTITNLTSHDNGATGLTIQTGNLEVRDLTHDVTVTGGSIRNNVSDGIVVREAEKVTIGGAGKGQGVLVEANGRFGILVEGASGVAITGNTIQDNVGGTGSDSTEIRVRGYLQTHLDSDPLNDVFEFSTDVTISGNTIGSISGRVKDYGASYSDTTGFSFVADNTVVFMVQKVIQDLAKVSASALPPNQTAISDGADTITGSEGTDSIAAGSGDDTVYGLAGNDKLYGADGNDMLDGGAGADTLTGGFGNDTYIADALDTIVEAALAGTDEVRTASASLSLASFANVEHLTFTGTGGFVGTGNALANRITGGTGNDFLNGGVGNDTLAGGAGNDTYGVDSLLDRLEDSGGVDTVRSLISYTLADGFEHLILTGSIGRTGLGNALANAITGTAQADRLVGLDGNDTLNGGAGADTLEGGAGDDTFFTDDDFDTVLGGSGIDHVISSVSWWLSADCERLTLTGSDSIDATGNALANTLFGNGAANFIEGLGGNDILNGGLGRDTLFGGAGNDTYIIERSDEVASDSSGYDTVIASASYSLGSGLEVLVLAAGAANGTGNTWANSITGNASRNILSGLGANDTLNGGSGNDIVSGGTGRDVLTGGSGYDRFVFDTAPSSITNADRITDFSVVYDTIALSRGAFSALKALPAVSSKNFVKGAAAIDANDFLIYNAATGTLTYDSNGSAAGGSFIIATLSKALSLTHADFMLF